MTLACDPAANVAYLRLREARGTVGTIEITPDLLVDIDETGAVCAIDLLDASAQLTTGDGCKLVLENARSVGRADLDVA